MKKFYILLVSMFMANGAIGQPTQPCVTCLPQGIYFSTQSQIDNFQTNYPNCTQIEGDVTISGYDIINLNGLSVLTSVGGSLNIEGNTGLTSLTGLNNVTSIGGYLGISANPSLSSLTGLNNLTFIEDELYIQGNDVLTNLIGFSNLTSIGADLSIIGNSALLSLTELGNVAAGSIFNLNIYDNCSLSNCNVQSICDYLTNPNGTVNIYGNLAGCNNPPEVANACGHTLSCLPYGNYYFINQSDIDNFQTNYSNCTNLTGVLKITGVNITNLNGLNTVTSIGRFDLENADALTSLTGLNNLSTISGYLRIYDNSMLTSITALSNVTSIPSLVVIAYNTHLTSLTGLDNVTHIGGLLSIGNNPRITNMTGLNALHSIGDALNIGYSDSLTSLTGLDNLTSITGGIHIESNNLLTNLNGMENVTNIGGSLWIGLNPTMTNLTGLDNIESGSISNLTIYYNDSLTFCAIKSVCDYLASPNGTIYLYNNAAGCNSQEEVETACGMYVNEISNENTISLYPNPVLDKITLETSHIKTPSQLSILNVNGQKVITHQITASITTIDVSNLPNGVYFMRVMSEGTLWMGKFLKR